MAWIKGRLEARRILAPGAERTALLLGERVVAYDDLLALDADDGAPGNSLVGVVAAHAEVLEPGAVSDAEAGDAQLRRGQLAAEVVAAAERMTGLGYDLASQ